MGSLWEIGKKMVLKCRGSHFEKKEVEGLKAEMDECSLAMCEEATEIGTHNALPPRPMYLVESLLSDQWKYKDDYMFKKHA